MKTALKIVGIMILGFIIIGVIAESSLDEQIVTIEKTEQTEQVEEVKEEIEYIEISAADIILLYEDNELKADTLLKDKRGIIVGKVNSIERVFGQVYVTLDGDDEYGITQVQCYFDDDMADALTELNTGDIVKIEGTIEGKGWNVDVKDCILR